MKEYLKRKLAKVKIDVDTFPKYYDNNGQIIKECQDGKMFVVDFDKNSNEIILKEYKNNDEK